MNLKRNHAVFSVLLIFITALVLIFSGCSKESETEKETDSQPVMSSADAPESQSESEAAEEAPAAEPEDSTTSEDTETAQDEGDSTAEEAETAPEAAPAVSAESVDLSVPALDKTTSGQGESAPVGYNLAQRTNLPPIDTKENFIAWMSENRSWEDPAMWPMKWDRLQADIYYHPDNTPETRRAFLLTPREDFVREYNMGQVYAHAALPIEDGQTISGPHLVIRMTNSLELQQDQKVLEIGTGSGYQSAILSNISNQVYTIEIKPNLYKNSGEIQESLEEQYPNYKNITRMQGDGYYGWDQYAPFDRIVVTCGIDHIPPDLLRQLKPDGIMVIPIGPMTGEQVILKITKRVDDAGNIILEREDIYDGKVTQAFVPFTASDGSWHQKNN